MQELQNTHREHIAAGIRFFTGLVLLNGFSPVTIDRGLRAIFSSSLSRLPEP